MRRVSSLAAALLAGAIASSAAAQEAPSAAAEEAPAAEAQEAPGEPSPIEAAAEAWQVGQIAKAGKLYEDALSHGGLPPSDTLAAFVRMGAWRASTGKNEAALAAFRNALIIDPAFEYPAEGGPRGKAIFQRARAAAEGQERLEVTVEVPAAVDAGKPFHVVATLPEPLVPLFDVMSIHVEDAAGKAEHQEEAPAAASIDFTVPAGAFRPGSALKVRVAALDPQHNEWARATGQSKVKAAPLAPIVFEPPPPPPPPPPDFWATKWPFVAGGAAAVVVGVIVVAAVAGGGSDIAEVGVPSWRSQTNSR